MVEAVQTEVQVRPARRPWYTILYVQVLIAIAVGVAVGYFDPQLGVALKPLGDGFIALIKMMIGPVIFCTIVHGISSMGDLKKVGRIGFKALLYFEAVSTVALGVGLLVGELAGPGRGFNIDPATLDPNAVASYVGRAKEEGIVNHLLAIIPDSFFGALARGDLLQVLLISILSGFSISLMGETGKPISRAIDAAARIFFGIIKIVVRVAPIGAFGAMAFTIGSQGIGALAKLGELILTFYAGRPRNDRLCKRILDPAVHRLHQGRASDRAWHQLFRNGPAAHDAEDGASWGIEVRGRPRRSDRIQLQS
jgi:aerobic C4-dicarboxylate transport protein